MAKFLTVADVQGVQNIFDIFLQNTSTVKGLQIEDFFIITKTVFCLQCILETMISVFTSSFIALLFSSRFYVTGVNF